MREGPAVLKQIACGLALLLICSCTVDTHSRALSVFSDDRGNTLQLQNFRWKVVGAQGKVSEDAVLLLDEGSSVVVKTRVSCADSDFVQLASRQGMPVDGEFVYTQYRGLTLLRLDYSKHSSSDCLVISDVVGKVYISTDRGLLAFLRENASKAQVISR